jgi:hypothetical protein
MPQASRPMPVGSGRVGMVQLLHACGVERPRYGGQVNRLIWRAAVAAGCALTVALLGTLAGPANLNVMLVAAIVIPIAVIGLIELPRRFRRHL